MRSSTLMVYRDGIHHGSPAEAGYGDRKVFLTLCSCMCSGGKIYVYKVPPGASLSNHTWLSLIEFAVEIRERIEVRAMATWLGFSLIASNSWGLSTLLRRGSDPKKKGENGLSTRGPQYQSPGAVKGTSAKESRVFLKEPGRSRKTSS